MKLVAAKIAQPAVLRDQTVLREQRLLANCRQELKPSGRHVPHTMRCSWGRGRVTGSVTGAALWFWSGRW